VYDAWQQRPALTLGKIGTMEDVKRLVWE